MLPKCENCKHFRYKAWTFREETWTEKYCTLNPEWKAIYDPKQHYCGQFKEKSDDNP